jgi:DedD protein
MAKELTDEELNLRRKSRRRLVGATALTLAVVVILPMVLDSQPKPVTQDIDLRIPDSNKSGEFVPNVVASAVPEVMPEAISAVQAVSAVEAVSAVTAISAPSAIAVVKPQAAAASAPSIVAPLAALKEPTKAVVVVKETPKTAPAEAKETVKPDESAAKAGTGYVAQVGAYASMATAKQELDKLKGWHFKAYIEKIGDKYRVRVGPYAEREKVDTVRKMLEKHGYKPVVTTTK